MFHVQFISRNATDDNWETCLSHTGPGFALFATGKEAAAYAQELKNQHGDNYRYRVRPAPVDAAQVDDTSWRERERAHFYEGRYLETPWHHCSWNDELRWEHYAHMSLTKPGMIAYTESPERGRADRQTIIAPGRYLNRYFADVLSPNEIERWASEAAVSGGAVELHFTQDADTIQEVYENGPSSCMSHSEDDYSGHCHPVRAYAGPDLALAYIGDEENGYSGRAIVWPEQKIYSCQYGDGSRMRLLLENAGYKRGDLDGARIRRIVDEYDEDNFIVPFIDGVSYAEDLGDFLRLGSGYINCQTTSGSVRGDPRPRCEHCDERVERDELTYVRDYGEHWCNDCAEEGTTYDELDGYHYSDGGADWVEAIGISFWSGQLLRHTTRVETLEDDGRYVRHNETTWVHEDLYATAQAIQQLAQLLGRDDPDQELNAAWEAMALEMLAQDSQPRLELAA